MAAHVYKCVRQCAAGVYVDFDTWCSCGAASGTNSMTGSASGAQYDTTAGAQAQRRRQPKSPLAGLLPLGEWAASAEYR